MLCHRGRSPDSTLQPRCSFADSLVPQMGLFYLLAAARVCAAAALRMSVVCLGRRLSGNPSANPGSPLVNIGTMVCFYVRYLLVYFYFRSTGINQVQLFSSSKYGLSAYFHFLSGYGFSFRLTPEYKPVLRECFLCK